VAAVTQWGLEGTYKVMPLGLIASVILFFRLKKIDIRKDVEVKKGFSYYSSSFKKFLPIFLVLAGITLTRGFMKSALTLYLPTFLREQGNDIWTAGVALSVLQLSGVAGTFFSGTLSDKIGRKRMLLIIAIASPILMWLFVSYHEILAFPILIVIGFFLVAPQSVMLAVIHELDTDNLPFVNGIYMTINFLISSLCLLAVGWVSDHIGLLLTFKIAAGLAIGAIFFVLKLKK
jgi:FSR family fosmidomycin resistance protein-like MFS transporter